MKLCDIIAVEVWDVISSRHSPAATSENYSCDTRALVSEPCPAVSVTHQSVTLSPADREIRTSRSVKKSLVLTFAVLFPLMSQIICVQISKFLKAKNRNN